MADYGASSGTISPFNTVTEHWRQKLQCALDYKETHFNKDANEARTFLKGGADLQKHIFGESDKSGDIDIRSNFPSPGFCLSLNRVAEMKHLFGAHLYHRNPYRQVNPRQQIEMPPELFMQQDPMLMQQMQFMPPEQQQQYLQFIQQQQQQAYQQYLDSLTQSDAVDLGRARLLEGYLNWTPVPLGLRNHMRMCLDEAVVTGLGLMWSESYRAPGSKTVQFGSFYDTVDNFAIDPDMETIEDALVCYRRRCRPVWQVEDQYTIPFGFPRGYLKGNTSSYNQNAAGNYGGKLAFKNKKGETNDLLVYWECYSRMGLGARLAGVPAELRDQLDQFGENVFLVICDTCEVPINFLGAKNGEDLQRRMRWPTPFWADDVWPFTHYQFHPQSRCVYPYSHVRPGLPELKFLSWCYSFLADKIMNTCVDWVVTLKQAGAELKKAIREGGGLRHIDLSASDGSTSIKDVVQFLQHPEMNTDIFTVLERIEVQFERRTNMTPLLYGDVPTQSRLASEAEFRQSKSMTVVDDMADCVEEASTQMARKEGLGAAYHLIPERDIAPALGPQASQFWGQLVNFETMLHSMEFRIEAGSIRKPNKERDQAQVSQIAQTLLPIYAEWAAAGQVGPFNEFVARMAKANDMPAKGLQLEPPPAQEGPTPEEMEMQKMQAEMEMDQQRMAMEMQQKQTDAQLDMAKAQMDLQQDAATHAQEMQQMREKHLLEMRMMQQRAQADRQMAQQKVKADAQMQKQKVQTSKEMAKAKVQQAKKKPVAAKK